MVIDWRYVALAAVWSLTLAAGPQPGAKNQPEKQQSQTQPKSRPTPFAVTTIEPVKVVQPNVNTPPCGPDQYQAKDDLCAQWKAADAASWAATWAMIGTLVAALGTAGLYWQIKLTREAVRDTGEATDAMRKANEIAELTQRVQFRPYVAVTEISHSINSNSRGSIRVTVKNFGGSVAKGVVVVVGWTHSSLPIPGMISYKIIKNKPFGDLPPSAEQTISLGMPKCDPQFIANLGCGAMALAVTVRTTFESEIATDVQETTISKLISEGEDFAKGRFRVLTEYDSRPHDS